METLNNTYEPQTGTVTINTIAGNDVITTINSICPNAKENLKILIITSGNITTEQAKIIGDVNNFQCLEVLELRCSATINNGALAAETFMNVKNLKTLILPNILAVGNRCFFSSDGASTIVRIELPDLKSIEGRSFYGCRNLAVLVLGEVVPAAVVGSSYWFKFVTNLMVFVPTKEAITQYKKDNVFKGFEYCIIGDKGIVVIDKSLSPGELKQVVDSEIERLHSSYSEIRRLTILKGIVGDWDINFIKAALHNLEILEIRLLADVFESNIKENAFRNMIKLKKVVLQNVTEIQDNAFEGCTSLKVFHAKSITRIGNSAFENCSCLEEVRFTKVTEVGDNAFKDCSSVTLIDMPSAIRLGRGALQNASQLINVKLKMLEQVEDKSFSGCSSLEQIVLQSVKRIGKYAFADNIKLKHIRVPEVTEIDSQAFVNCVNIDYMCLGKVVPAILGNDILATLSETLTALYVNPKSVDLFTAAKPWNNFFIKADPEIYTGEYYKGDYKTGLNFYGFNANISKYNSGIETGTKPAPLSLKQVIRWAADTGFDAVDIPAYYFKGWAKDRSKVIADDVTIEEAIAFAKEIGEFCRELGLEISGTGTANNFANVNEAAIATDIERAKLWIDAAQAMGAPVIRVFSGDPPADYDELGWEYITRNRIIPAIKILADYAKDKNVIIGVQNHGDMLYNSERCIQFMEMLNTPDASHPNGYTNVGIINDTGYYREYAGEITNDRSFDWYSNIAAILPYSVNFQVKRKPGGAGTEDWIDLNRLCQDIRRSSYRGFLPMELVWSAEEPNNPINMEVPAYEEIAGFLHQLQQVLEDTKSVEDR